MLIWLSVLWTAFAAPTLYVVPEDDGGFRVVDARGKNIGAWHFAHFTRDREKVGDLRSRLYFRRTSAIVALVGGFVLGAAANGLIFNQRQHGPNAGNGGFHPDLAVLGCIATAAVGLMVVHPTNFVMRRPEWLHVDTHYSRDEAIDRIQRRAGIWVAPTGVYARF